MIWPLSLSKYVFSSGKDAGTSPFLSHTHTHTHPESPFSPCAKAAFELPQPCLLWEYAWVCICEVAAACVQPHACKTVCACRVCSTVIVSVGLAASTPLLCFCSLLPTVCQAPSLVSSSTISVKIYAPVRCSSLLNILYIMFFSCPHCFSKWFYACNLARRAIVIQLLITKTHVSEALGVYAPLQLLPLSSFVS